jgi:uncharacterized iron-regulated membrane protein
MVWARRLRRVHRAATLVVGAQLLIWTFTGVAFSWFDFQAVRGAGDRAPAPSLPLDEVHLGAPQAVAAARPLRGARAVTAVELHARAGHPVWTIGFAGADEVVVDARDGAVLPALSDAEAAAIAVAAFARPVGVAETRRVHDPPDLEGDAVRVRLDDPRATEVYVSPSTGAILSWRNRVWRAFDRLWSLHVMGWVSRDNPAHGPMRIAAALAFLAALSGAALWLATRRRRRTVSEPEGSRSPR